MKNLSNIEVHFIKININELKMKKYNTIRIFYLKQNIRIINLILNQYLLNINNQLMDKTFKKLTKYNK